jgi:hypothetical protein
MNIKRKIVHVFFVFIAIYMTGCSSLVNSVGKTGTFQDGIQAHTKKDFEETFKAYEEVEDKNETSDLLFLYDAGTIGYYINEYKGSVNYFDMAEGLIKKYDDEIMASHILQTTGSILANDSVMDYRPRIYEKIMVNTYKGIDFLLLGDFSNARIEFNRALVRQDRAKSFFKAEIEQRKKEIRQEAEEKFKKKTKGNLNIDQAKDAVTNKETNSIIEKKYSNLFAFKPYPDFVNPFTTYLAGIYFLNRKDYSKATDLLKESYGMVKGVDDGANVVRADFILADRMKSSLKQRKKHYTWVIFMNGLGPEKKEKKINIPVFLFSKNVYYTGIALPTLKMRNVAFDNLKVATNKKTLTTKKIASMDRIVKTEFKNRFPIIVGRAVARTVVQTMIQYQLNKNFGTWGGIVGAIYQFSMNRADTRMWGKLPKEFQVARVATSKHLTVTAGNKKIVDLVTNPKKNYMVFVTIPTNQTEPLVSYQEF